MTYNDDDDDVVDVNIDDTADNGGLLVVFVYTGIPTVDRGWIGP